MSKEVSELSNLIAKLRHQVSYDDGVDLLIAEEILTLAEALHSELQSVKERLERLERVYGTQVGPTFYYCGDPTCSQLHEVQP